MNLGSLSLLRLECHLHTVTPHFQAHNLYSINSISIIAGKCVSVKFFLHGKIVKTLLSKSYQDIMHNFPPRICACVWSYPQNVDNLCITFVFVVNNMFGGIKNLVISSDFCMCIKRILLSTFLCINHFILWITCQFYLFLLYFKMMFSTSIFFFYPQKNLYDCFCVIFSISL